MNVVFDHLDRFFHGAVVTVELTLVAYIGALIIGTVVAAFRVSPVPPLRFVGTLYVDVIRNIPLVVHCFLFVFGLTQVGIKYSLLASAFIVLAAYHGAFAAEIIRSGINTVAKGQAEAARALGFTFPAVLGRVVLPQAFRAVVAPLGSLFIALIKNTAIVFTIGVVELTGATDRLNTDTGQPSVYVGAAAAYFILILPAAFAISRIERRVRVAR